MKRYEGNINKKYAQNIFYKTNPSGGISLIVLVITIIVVIILVAVIISLQNNNPMTEANKARYKSDRANMQMIFSNTVGKIMAEKQEIVEVKACQLNEVTSGVKNTTGEVIYKINNEEVGKIIFTNEQSEDKNNYITGKKLPIYSSKTIWNIDDEGILRLQVGDKKYSDEDSSTSGGTTQTGGVSEEAYNEILKRLEALENKEDSIIQGKSVPAGTVISYMGNKAPEGYLFCDGKEYNIEEYKVLAEQIKEEFGKYDYYGGNGTTTFKVPNLKGEFLRGSGANSYSGQGGGSLVGTHQNATNIKSGVWSTGISTTEVRLFQYGSNAVNIAENCDVANWTTGSSRVAYTPSKREVENFQGIDTYTTRPTNTSVLYCIKY